MNPEIENQIRNNVTWNKLPSNFKQFMGNSQKEYEKAIVSYCIKNQARFKDTLVRYVRKDEKKYYEELLQYSTEHYMLYPYHLSDIFVRGLRITPFNYYIEMMSNLMTAEKSYDTLPNFTAIDCLRLLGIGRNQYIDIMNKYRSSNKLRIGFTRRKPARSLLPTQPIDILIEPWWVVNVGCVTDEDVRGLSDEEKKTIDLVIDNQKMEAKKLNFDIVHILYRKGLIYLDVPLNENDFVEVPPLEGFVMNRITGDYFETLLYKLFVSIDERTSLSELASLLQIDIDLVLNAVSLYCRLSFAIKKFSKPIDETPESSWYDYKKKNKKNIKIAGDSLLEWNPATPTEDTNSSIVTFEKGSNDDENKLSLKFEGCESDSKETNDNNNMLVSSVSVNNFQQNQINNRKRIGFLFDSTLTAFLMMGNLSSGLKNHAVTMFEVGKLSDQSIENFLFELEKISHDQNEGDAQRYFDHAKILKSTLQYLRMNNELKLFSGFKKLDDDQLNSLSTQIPIENEPLGLDLLRCESLASLDDESRQRILAKNYSILISMAPYSSYGDSYNSPPISSDSPFHIGPAIPEVNSVWFKLYLYDLIEDGPCSFLIPRGSRLTKLPETFKYFDKFQIITWGHDPIISSHSNLLITLNDALSHGPILVSCYSEYEDSAKTINISFNDDTHPLFLHPLVQKLHEKLELKYFIGYITLLNPYKTNNDQMEDWIVVDLRYGIPLFDNKLNLTILSIFKEKNLGSFENLDKMLQINRRVSLELINFIQKYQKIFIMDSNNADFDSFNQTEDYLISIASKSKKSSSSSSIVIYPTQAVLFEDGSIKVVDDL